MPTVIYGVSLLKILFIMMSLWTVYLIVETIRREGWLKGEYARKAIHISLGIILASFPIYMRRREIVIINLLFFFGLIFLSGFLKWFKAYEEVNRWTIGQYVYPLGVLIVTFYPLTWNPFIYSFSILILGLADGFAAIIGQAYGRRHYYFFGGNKTLLGSFTFFCISLTLLSIYTVMIGDLTPVTAVMIPIGALFLTATEGFIAGGFDNLVIPFFAAIILQVL